MVPAERSFVDLSQGETAALIRVLDVDKVIVEVVVGGVSTGRLGDGGMVRLLGRHGCSLALTIALESRFRTGWLGFGPVWFGQEKNEI